MTDRRFTSCFTERAVSLARQDPPPSETGLRAGRQTDSETHRHSADVVACVQLSPNMIIPKEIKRYPEPADAAPHIRGIGFLEGDFVLSFFCAHASLEMRVF